MNKRTQPSLTDLPPDERIEEIRRIAKEFNNNNLMGSMVLDLLMYYDNVVARRDQLLAKCERQAQQITMLETSRRDLRKANGELHSKIRKSLRGITGWKEGDEPAEVTIRRFRDMD